ncbi:myristoylated alanine-rich C-kinase substrate-like [Acipenser ruthenus]|uniref:myristoylated alanine-rich C-kinase substrate-like n=1 Tax=Acipenser ruthenus TaxID=7906 RepID=UPI002741735B|nr:myristoylated alanine-rich C-kinase substrate-like [Acipenser ruthenus]
MHGVRCLLKDSLSIEAFVKAMVKTAASKMYGNAVFFLKSEAAMNTAIKKGLTALGELKTAIHPTPLGCKDQPLRHMLSFHLAGQEAVEGSSVVPFTAITAGSWGTRKRAATSSSRAPQHPRKAPRPSESTSPPGASKKPIEGGKKKYPPPSQQHPRERRERRSPRQPDSLRHPKKHKRPQKPTTEGSVTAEVAEGAQEGNPKEYLPQASLPGEDRETEQDPEAGVGSANNVEPMQATPAEGLEGGEEPESTQGSALGGDPLPLEQIDQTTGPQATEGPVTVAVTEGAQEGPPKEQPPQVDPSAGDKGPGPGAATGGETAPSSEVVPGSTEMVEKSKGVNTFDSHCNIKESCKTGSLQFTHVRAFAGEDFEESFRCFWFPVQ